LELDEFENISEHFIVIHDKKIIGCGRIRAIDKYAKLERIAILKEYRCKGFGTKLTKYLIDYCKQKNFNQIRLHSQIYVVDFYKKLGFIVIGEPFDEAGIKHLEMQMSIA